MTILTTPTKMALIKGRFVYSFAFCVLFLLLCFMIDQGNGFMTISTPMTKPTQVVGATTTARTRTRTMILPSPTIFSRQQRQQQRQEQQQQQQKHQQSVASSFALYAKPPTVPVDPLSNSILKGRLFHALSKFLISPHAYMQVGKAVLQYLKKDWAVIALTIFFLNCPIPLAKKIYYRRFPDRDEERNERSFKFSKTRKIAQTVKEIAELFGILYAVEIGIFILGNLGFKFVGTYPVNQWAGGILASLWGAKNLSAFKAWILSRGGRRDITKSNGLRLINRFADILIYAATVLTIFDFLSVKTGMALRSLFGLSSVASLVFTLAARELATEFLSSLAIQGTNIYEEGDLISMQDGSLGIVQKLGWLNTHVRRGDEFVVRIPNTQLARTRLANVSRARLSSVIQKLNLSYDDVDKIPQFIKDTKKEIRNVCPTLIDDGSRPFRVHWNGFNEYSLEVIVEVHTRTKPMCDAYFEMREDILMAIVKAAKRNGVKFSYSNYLRSGIPLLDLN